ncbi:MAG: UDP-N-acetylmuramoyl-L-alanyl-D-glutamate--2,6-diaminopimelate ligase [Armatimonadia bacterium]
MRLPELLEGLAEGQLPDVEVTAVTADSRAVTPGSLFVAITGTVSEGHDYIADALKRGAVAVVYQRPEYAAQIPQGVAAVQVAASRRAAAVLADRFWGHPSGDLTLVAVTGTNGKTTTVHLLESIFQAAGHKTGMIGTLGRRVGEETVVASRTTPDAIELQALLARMRDEGITHVSMELSSHAIDLDRAWGCCFAAALFTNLSQDHLDWHETMDAYRGSKSRLFSEYAAFAPGEMVGAINVDDEAGRLIAAEAKCRVVGYGTGSEAQVRVEGVERSWAGTQMNLVTPTWQTPVRLQLVGQFNVMNALGAAACAWGLGVDQEAIVSGLQALASVPGRLEKVDRGQDFAVLVDYAHTPDALENVLRAARELEPSKLICVLGCGGDRDRTKRPQMGKIAGDLADVVIVTSDNPRSERPEDIVSDITAGMAGTQYQVEVDREQAIHKAIAQAGGGDIVVIAGKGHEDYQEFEGGRKVHFDDREVAAEALDKRPSL